jgi:hypothetical protein
MTSYTIAINSNLHCKPSDLDVSNRSRIDKVGCWTCVLDPINIPGHTMRLSVEKVMLPDIQYSFPYHSCMFYMIINNIQHTHEIPTDRIFANGDEFATFASTLASDCAQFTYSSTTYRLTIKNTSSYAMKLIGSWRYNDSLDINFNSAIERMGFTQDLTSVTIPVNGTLVAESPLRLLGTTCFYIQSSTMDQTTSYSAFKETSGILTVVPSAGCGNISQNMFVGTTQVKVPENKLRNITFRLLDDSFYGIDCIATPITIIIRIDVD